MQTIGVRIGYVLVLVAMLALLLGACEGDDPTPTPTPTTAPAAAEPLEPVKIGSLMDFTGELGEFGGPMNDAVLLAAEHINEAGGVLGGREIEIVAEDGATSDVTSVDAARKLVNVDGVSALIGPLASGITLAVANAVTIDNQVPQISPSATSPALTLLDDDDFVFRTAPSDAFQGVILAELAYELGYRNAGALFVNNPYGQGLADQFTASFQALGGQVTAISHESGQPSYASELARVTENDPDVLVAVSYPVSAGVYIREAIESGAADTFLFVDGSKSEDLIDAVGAGSLEGMYGTAPGAVESEATAQFASDYASAHGDSSLPFIRESYDAMAIFGLAVQAAGSDDPVAVRDAMRAVAGPPGVEVGPGAAELARALQLLQDGQEINYQGASGPVDLDENGDVSGAMEIWKIAGGALVSESVVTEPGTVSVAPAPPKEPVKVGSVMDFTGELGEFGGPMNDAVLLAAGHINAAGGVLGGREIEVVSEDGATSDVTAVDAARKLVNVDGVSALIGPLASGITLAVANAVTIPNQVPEISPSATSPALTVLEDDDFIFRTAPSDAFQGVVLANLARGLGYQNAAVLFVNNPYGQGLADQFTASFQALGGQVTAVSHESGQPSYASELSRATANDPDVLVAISYPVSAGVYVREAIESGAADTFLFVDGSKSEELIAAVGADSLEGMYGTAPGAVESEATAQFASDYAAAYGDSSLPFIRESYDAMAIFGLAIEAAGSDDPIAIRDAMRAVAGPPGVQVGPGAVEFARALQLLQDGQEINYQGASGPVDLDENGDVSGAMEIWKIAGGQIVTERVITE